MRFGYDNHCLLRDGTAWFPVMGEIHYSRYKESLWEESLRKIKAGGVEIVSSYVIWIHHEEEEGIFRFDGCRNLRRFLELCKKVGLLVFLRLGPFAHGEVRNGGLPDWVVEKGKRGVLLRSNDEEYLRDVGRYWMRVFEQVRGFLHEEGGPVIGVQIENEYGHVGGMRGEAGEAHMRTLTCMAKEIGFCVPFYTATGWGGACIGDLLPVMGGYCEAPWDPRVTELEPNSNYVFSHTRSDALIGCDYRRSEEITYDEMLELASQGAQVLHNRSVELAKKYHVNMEVVSSLERKPGTKVKEVVKMEKTNIAGVAKDTSIARIAVVGLDHNPGVAFRVFSLLGKAGINVDAIIQSIGRDTSKDISFTLPRADVEEAVRVLEEQKGALRFDHLTVEDKIAKVSIVGAGMMTTPGVAAKMFEALYDANINIQMINTSEIRVSVLIDEEDAVAAVRAVHDKFFGDDSFS